MLGNATMPGFLGTRGDFPSDLLILALAVVAPVLVVAVWLGRKRHLRAHRLSMLALLGVLVAYVVVYEVNLLYHGGTAYLMRVTTMAALPYFIIVGGHVALGTAALVVGVWAVRRGQRALGDRALERAHGRVGWRGVALLGLSSVTGVVVYWVTFVV